MQERRCMLYALSLDTRDLIRATPNAKAICPDCNQEVIPKCGFINSPHWAHKSLGDCDSHWEKISQWHLDWQNTIDNPIGGINVEVRIVKTERYKRADLISHSNIITEFQKSPMSLEERYIRESHYGNINWVIHKEIKDSKTWKRNTDNGLIFIDTLDGFLSFKYEGMQFNIPKDKFIRTFINGTFNWNNGILDTVIVRSIRRSEKKLDAQSLVLAFNVFSLWDRNLKLYLSTEKRNRLLREEELKRNAESELKTRLFYLSLNTQHHYLSSLSYNNDTIDREIWISNYSRILDTQLQTRRYRKEKKMQERNNAAMRIIAFEKFNCWFDLIKRDWVTSILQIDTTPLPATTALQRKQKFARDRHIRRAHK